MNKTEEAPRFSPQEASRRELIIAFLIEKISNLPKDALEDLAALGPEIARCESEEEFHEIAETMREIIFPEIIGTVVDSEVTRGSSTKRLRRWAGSLGKRIKAARLAAGLTQSRLASDAGLPQSHVSRIESGRHSPSRHTVERIARALNKRVCDFDPSCD